MPLPSAGGCRHSAAAGPACSPRQRQGRARTPPRVRVLERERRRGRHNVQLVSLKHGQVGPWRGGRHHAGAHAVRARGGRRIRYRSALARHTGVSAHGRKRGRHGAGWLHSTRCWRPRRRAPLRASRFIHTRVSRSLRRRSASSPCTCKGLCQMPNQDVKLKSVAVCWSAAAPRGRRQRGARAAGPASDGPAPSSRRPGPRSRLPPAAAAACGRSASALAARRSARAQTLDPACILQPPKSCRAARQSGGGTPLQQVPGCRRAAANLGTPQEGRPLRAAPPSSRHTLLGKAAYYDQQEHGRSSARFCARRRMSVSARPQPQPRCRSRQRATGAFTEGGNRRGARRRN